MELEFMELELTKEQHLELVVILGYAAAKAGMDDNPEMVQRIKRMTELVRVSSETE